MCVPFGPALHFRDLDLFPHCVQLKMAAVITSVERRVCAMLLTSGWLEWVPWPIENGRRDVLGLQRLVPKTPGSFHLGLLKHFLELQDAL